MIVGFALLHDFIYGEGMDFMQIVRGTAFQEEKTCKETGGSPGGQKGFGIAADIGTTTIAMSLYNLGTGEELGSAQEKNCQTQMGADVMMRLMHCQQGRQKQLCEMIQKQLGEMARNLCHDVCRDEEMKRFVVVGNPTMCHIFLGMDARGLAGSPFQPAYTGAYCCSGSDVGMRFFGSMEVCVIAGVDAHVGADAVAMAAALRLQDPGGTRIAVDVGTNAEIILSHQGRIVAGSAPAGPAFEGAGISQGMRGEPGAIAAFKIALHADNIILDVIGMGHGIGEKKVKPCGICGSGLVDAVAELCRCGLIRADGYLLSRQEAQDARIPLFLCERLTSDGFILYQPASDDCVVLTREDIRQFQLAKAAVQAGIRILLQSQELGVEQMGQFYVAGVFGGHINVKSAIRIGLFPDMPAGKVHIVGNAAGDGAAQSLLSERFCRETERIAAQAKHVELALQKEFQSEFLGAMKLVSWRLEG